ncbi:MAG: DUF2306 domain-containing protein [Flavisolibacter sp.]
MPAIRSRISTANISLLLAYLFFCFLMLEIVVQYIPAGTDTAFLGIKQEYVQLPFYLPAFYIHVFTALMALPAGFTQFSNYILKNFRQVHRINGRIYVLAIVFAGAPSGFIIGLYANGGIASRISFCLLAVLWIWFTLMALRMALLKKFTLHKAFMYRSFALTLSAITLRGWKYILTLFFHFHPMDAYRIVAWLGWTVNLAIAEFIIYKKYQK